MPTHDKYYGSMFSSSQIIHVKVRKEWSPLCAFIFCSSVYTIIRRPSKY